MSKKNNASIQMIADYEGDISNLFNVNVEGEVPVLATRNMVMFPGVLCPILIGRDNSLKLIETVKKSPNTTFAIFCQKNSETEEPQQEDLYEYGVYARLVRVLEIPGHGQNVTAIVQSLGRCKLDKITKKAPYLQGLTHLEPEILPKEGDSEYHAAAEDLRKQTIEYIKENDDIADEAQFALSNLQNDVLTINYICTNMPFSIEDKMKMLMVNSMIERILVSLMVLNKEMHLLELQKDIRA